MARAWSSKTVLLIVAVAMIGTAGCTSISKTMQAWVGHHFSELIAAWGPPDKTFSDGRGGQIFIYTRTLRWV